MYRRIPDLVNFWEDHWGGRPISDVLSEARTGRLGELEYSLITFLPQSGPVLEAGCGTGRVAEALSARGYEVIGVDYAAGTVEEVLKVSPALQVEVGNIEALRWPDQHFDGYISIGVLEHFHQGPDTAVAEAYRVLAPGGVALISVPYRNHLRTRVWKKATECDEEFIAEGWRFYQDHVEVEDFKGLLHRHGFEVCDVHPYGMYGALLRDSALLAKASEKGLLRHRVRKVLKKVCSSSPLRLRMRYSHMMMFVCKRPADADDSAVPRSKSP